MADLKNAFKILMRSTHTFSEIEKNGILIDVEYANKQIKLLLEKASYYEKMVFSSEVGAYWKKRYGFNASIKSDVQIKHIVYEHLGLWADGFSKKEEAHADKAWLGKTKHPVCEHILLHKKYIKAAKTIEGILKETDENNILHPSFNLHTVQTYRTSSSGPNFQNMPIRDPELGKIIRSCFIPRKSHRFMEFDFSGLEVRMSVPVHKDPRLLRYIVENFDMHSHFTKRIFSIPDALWDSIDKKIKKNLRYAGKNGFSFSLQYGNFYANIAVDLWKKMDELDLRISKNENMRDYLYKTYKESGYLDKIINKYEPRTDTILEEKRSKLYKFTEVYCDISLDKGIASLSKDEQLFVCFFHKIEEVENWYYEEEFPVYNEWRKTQYAEYIEKGYFDNLAGFRFKGVMSRNQSYNFPVQSISCVAMLWCIEALIKEIKEKKLKTLIIGQIHDSIVMSVPVEETMIVFNLLKDIMEHRILEHYKWITVPLEAECDITPVDYPWYYKQELPAMYTFLDFLKNGDIEGAKRFNDTDLKFEADVIDKIIEKELTYL